MILFADSPPLASYVCIAIFVSMVAFVVWGLYYSAKQRGADALGALFATGGAILGTAAAIGVMFATGIGGAFTGMILGVLGAVFGAKGGKSLADSLRGRTSDPP